MAAPDLFWYIFKHLEVPEGEGLYLGVSDVVEGVRGTVAGRQVSYVEYSKEIEFFKKVLIKGDFG